MIKDDRLEMLSVLRELHIASGFRISVHDTNFREIEAYPVEISPYCRLIQSSPEGKRRCEENDRRAFLTVREKPGVYLYKCCFGLYEAVAPLYIFGKLAGYLMMGQSIDFNKESRETLVRSAQDLTGDYVKLAEAAEAVHVCEKKKILSYMKILDICAQYITLSNRFYADSSDITEKIRDYLERHYAENITIKSLCLKFFRSRTAVMTAFKSKFGIGIIEYLTMVRLNAAKQQLLNTSRPVREIAYACGYRDQNYFCRAFKKAFAQTPTQFRNARH